MWRNKTCSQDVFLDIFILGIWNYFEGLLHLDHNADMAKLRPAKHFLRPLKQTVNVDLGHNLWENTLIWPVLGLQ